MLLESLIAILIFSVGILAIVGMQGSAITATSDAKYRSDAGILANNLIAQMWVSDRSGLQSHLLNDFQGGNGVDGTKYAAWVGNPGNPDPSSVFGILPGAQTNPPQVSMVQTVQYLDLNNQPVLTSQVTIVIFWQTPGDQVSHSFTVTTQIG